jgi:hypothetical protein
MLTLTEIICLGLILFLCIIFPGDKTADYIMDNTKHDISNDQFKLMWDQQHEFMKLLKEKRNFPEFPVDVTSKQGQKLLDDITFHIMKELFESNQHLKNSKSHRITNVPDFDRSAYIEELVDAFHLQLEICIAAGITREEFFEAYMKKFKKLAKQGVSKE